jgi:hypothetical protein
VLIIIEDTNFTWDGTDLETTGAGVALQLVGGVGNQLSANVDHAMYVHTQQLQTPTQLNLRINEVIK